MRFDCDQLTELEEVTVILTEKPDTWHIRASRHNPLVARITAKGEPHRRFWTIKVHWRYRDSDGKVRGSATIGNHWLHSALQQLNVVEQFMFQNGTGANVLEPEAVLYCSPELFLIVRRNATYYGVWYRLAK